MYQLWIERDEMDYDLVTRANSMRECFDALEAIDAQELQALGVTGSYIERRDGRIMFVDGTCRTYGVRG